MPDELSPEERAYREGRVVLGPETETTERIERIRRGLAEEEPDDALTPDEILDELVEDFVAEEAVDQGGGEGEPDVRRGVVVELPAEALRWWARWHTEEGEPRQRRFGGLSHPSKPTGSPVGFQVAAFVEETQGFLLVERRLRAEWGLPPARDALPVVPPLVPTVVVLMAMPMFMDALDARLPAEFFPPEVVAGVELTLEERAAQERIEAKYRARYPSTWRG